MKRTNTRLAVCITLLILVLIFIWGNSCLPAPQSRMVSLWFRNLIAPLFGWPIITKPGGSGSGVLRKVAHFVEFSWLGLCLSWLMHMLRSKKWEAILLAVVAGVSAACIDEGIQFFIPGRGPGWKDVGIDSLGLLLGIGILSLIPLYKYLKQKNSKNHLEENKL